MLHEQWKLSAHDPSRTVGFEPDVGVWNCLVSHGQCGARLTVTFPAVGHHCTSRPHEEFKCYKPSMWQVLVGAMLIILPAPARYCDEHVCLSFCLSVRSNNTKTTRKKLLPNVLCMLPVVMSLSSSGGVAICSVLPVLWMTSLIGHNGPMASNVHSKRQ